MNLITCKKILIVDDCFISATLIQTRLNELGYSNADIAANGKAAMALFSNDIDLIFMDINLPDTNGIELTKIFQKFYQKRDIPIICHSTDFLRHEKDCINAGMVDYLPKPFSPDDLDLILECWLPSFNIRKVAI